MLIGIREIEAKYEVLDKLGEGGMGAVYLARHKLLEEQRVIKTIKPHLGRDQDLQNRFLREAQVAAKLRHPHIATVHDFAFTEDATAYIVMAHIEGQNLREFQRGGGLLRVEEVIDIARQALDALGYLHSKSFVHRDISTDNLMLSRHGSKPWVTLIDLGLAKSLETSSWNTKTGMVVGKVRYISPEQLNAGMDGVEVDARSDLYSFGVVLYELLTGEYPITGDDDVSLIAGHLYREPRPFDETDPRRRIPERMRSVVMKALSKKADERWTSAAELSEALERCRSPEATVEIDPGRLDAEEGAPAGPKAPADAAPTQIDIRSHVTGKVLPAAAAPAADADSRRTLPVDLEAATAPISRRSLEQADREPAESRAAAPARRRPERSLWPLAVWLLVGLLAAGIVWHLASSRDAGVAIDWGDHHALVIGNDDYVRLPKLQTPRLDARDLGSLLEQAYGFRVTVLENATRDDILNTLFELTKTLTLRDSLLVFYAGHGQVDGSARYWQGVDSAPGETARWVHTEKELGYYFEQMKARHVLVIADSCYAGDDLPAVEPRGAPESLDETRKRHTRISRVVMTSGGDQPVADRGTGRHSVFAEALLELLRANDEVVGAEQLFERLAAAVESKARQAGVEQSPTLQPIPYSRDQGGEFFFVPAGT